MDTLLGASWKSTVIGFLFGVVLYFYNLGPNLPTNTHEWLAAGISACAVAFGKVVKDFNVTNATIVSPAGVRSEASAAVKASIGLP